MSKKMNKKEVMSILDKSVDSSSLSISSTTTDNQSGIVMNDSGGTITYDSNTPFGSNTCWDYWQNYYYPTVIHHSYPVYIQDRAKDNGKKAFEIIKMLADKKMVKLDKVKDFIDLMDTLIKIL